MAEDGARGGETEVAGEREVETPAEAVAADRSHDRLRRAGETLEEKLGAAGKVECGGSRECANFGDVGAGGEAGVGAVEDDARDIVIRKQPIESA